MSQVPYCVLYNITHYNNEFQSGGEQLKQYYLFTIYSNDCLIYKDINTLYDIIIIISRDTTILNKHNLECSYKMATVKYGHKYWES